ncbi:MAG TPA: aminotransferase class V-fold PLP-dependent enzyme [Thermomicrobiales bacterium]|nr:aminotransferase class V-fold PLP-dependent enzyme [Thermomicrobiales bacterium]
MGIYEGLGVRRIINVNARWTALGGSKMPEPVLAAMNEATGSYVDMHELQRAVGRRIAELTRNDGAYVTAGAAAGLVVSTLAAMNRGDLPTIARAIEGQTPERHEIVIHRAHRIPYDPAVILAGARLVEIGNALQTFPWELDAAIGPATAAVLFVAGEHVAHGALSLAQAVAIAHARGVPVIVDAAAQLPPAANLWRFTRNLGADLAVFSGGKDLRGPQASGLIVGAADWIEACRVNGSPHQRLARPMKAGKEEMAGLVVAIERYLALDHAAQSALWEATVQDWIDAVAGLPGVAARRQFPDEAGQPAPRARIDLDPAIAGITGVQLHQRLWEGEPGIAVALEGPNAISLSPSVLDGDDPAIVGRRVREILTPAPVAV